MGGPGGEGIDRASLVNMGHNWNTIGSGNLACSCLCGRPTAQKIIPDPFPPLDQARESGIRVGVGQSPVGRTDTKRRDLEDQINNGATRDSVSWAVWQMAPTGIPHQLAA